MSSFFKKQPTVKEQAKTTKKVVNKEKRTIEREMRDLERQEKETMKEIRERAKQSTCKGNDDRTLVILSKQLVQIRKAKDQMLVAKGNISALGLKAQTMSSQVSLSQSVQSVGKVMGQVTASVDIGKLQKEMQMFERENVKMELTEDMMSDALCDVFDGDGVDEEADLVTNQVLAELGLETTAGMASAPVGQVPTSKIQDTRAQQEEEMERDLAELMKRADKIGA